MSDHGKPPTTADELSASILEQVRASMDAARKSARQAALEEVATAFDQRAAALRDEAKAGGDWKQLMIRSAEAAYGAKLIRDMMEA